MEWQWCNLVCWYHLLLDQEGFSWILCVLLLEGSQRRRSWGLKELVKTRVVTWMWSECRMIHWYWLTTSNNASPERWRERHWPLCVWATTDSAPTSVGLRVLAPRTSRERTVPDPPLRLTWEWQDYALLQANPFSNQLTQHHIWWKMWFGLDFTRICQFFCRFAFSQNDMSPGETDQKRDKDSNPVSSNTFNTTIIQIIWVSWWRRSYTETYWWNSIKPTVYHSSQAENYKNSVELTLCDS